MFYWGVDNARVRNIRWRVRQIVGRGYVGGYWLVGNERQGRDGRLDAWSAVVVYAPIAEIIKEYDPMAKVIGLGLVRPNLEFLREWNRAWGWMRDDEPSDLFAGYHVHLYTNFSPHWREELEAWLDATPGMECWVTEYGHLDDLGVELMTEMTNWLAANPRVDRYAVFYAGLPNGEWPDCSLYTWDGDRPVMTELGRAYARLPETLTPTVTIAPTATPQPTATLTPTPTQEPRTPRVYRIFIPFYEP